MKGISDLVSQNLKFLSNIYKKKTNEETVMYMYNIMLYVDMYLV